MKTLFFSLAMKNVFRNLFFFPESVFFRLHKELEFRDDMRLVLIIPEKDYDKYDAFLKPYLSEKCIIETVPKIPYHTFLQKLFYFFYSYLVYTGTTKTLATMQMRPGDPPAGGKLKKYLAPVKLTIARTFGRSRLIKKKLVPFLYYRFFRTRPFESLFDKYQPDLVFSTHLYGQFDTHLLAEAKRRKTDTTGMIANWDHFDKYYLPFQVDTLLVQSDQIRDLAIEHQKYDPESISVVGYPHCDLIVNEQQSMSRSEVLKSLGFPKDAKLLIYVSASAYGTDEPDVIEKILEWADQKKFGCNLHLVIRPYLGGRGADKDFDEEKYNRFEEHPRVAFYRREFWGDLEKSIYFINIMSHADVVVVGYSTMVLEAAMLDRPLISPSFDGYHKRPLKESIRRFELREHFQDVLRTGALRQAGSFDDLCNYIDMYLKNPNTDSRERRLLRERLLYKSDGLASERITRYLLTQLEKSR